MRRKCLTAIIGAMIFMVASTGGVWSEVRCCGGAGGNFIQPFAIRNGGRGIAAEEVPILAKYDMFTVNRHQHDNVKGNTWSAIKAINPNTELFVYQGSRVRDVGDERSIKYQNNVGRWNVSRGHSMGNLNTDNPELFLLDSDSKRIYTPAYPHSHVMDIGSERYINYWLEATIHDLTGQPWTADGIFIDVVPFRLVHMSAAPVKYKPKQWMEAQHNFINKVVAELGKKKQKVICNTVLSNQIDFDNYVILDKSSSPPYGLFHEGAFAVKFGRGDVQFYPEKRWKLEVDLLSQIRNFKVAYMSQADLDEGQSGTDNWGKPVTFRDILWYSMASYHIGKNTVENNSYWGFIVSYNKAAWYDEYDHINLGNAVGKYQITKYGRNNIYWREFEKGYVYVNPTRNDVSSIRLTETCRQLKPDNFKDKPSSIRGVENISLSAHRAAFLLKK